MPPFLLYLKPTTPEFAPQVTAFGAAEKWDCIDDWPPNGDDDYVTTNSGSTGIWSLTSAAELDPDHPIQHVVLHSTVKGSPGSAVTGVTAILFKSPGEYPGAVRTLEAGADYRTFRDVFTTNPETGAPWQIADFASWLIGHSMTYTDPVPPRLTSLILEVMCARSFHGGPTSRSPKASAIDLVNLGVSLSSLSPKASMASLSPSAVASSLAPKAEES